MRKDLRTLLGQFILVTTLIAPTSYFAAPLLQAPQLGVQLSPVPIWPSNGVIPKEVSDKYVFYDPRTEEYVIAYPENLGRPEFERTPGRLLISRFPTTRGAKPSIQFSIVQDQEKYRYTYRLANAGGARRSITSWALATPVQPDGPLTAPSNWVVAPQRSSINDVGNALGTPRMEGFLVNWFVMDEVASIATEKTLEGFSVVSSYRPGMSAGYVRAGFFTTPSAETLPDAVREQLGRVSSIAFSAEPVLTVAPKFPAGTPRERIAMDFHSGIKRMIDARQLNGQSPLVKEALDRLSPYFQVVEAFKNVPFTLSQRPGNPTEVSLQEALILAMN